MSMPWWFGIPRGLLYLSLDHYKFINSLIYALFCLIIEMVANSWLSKQRQKGCSKLSSEVVYLEEKAKISSVGLLDV